jgi:hypothetical protein
LPAKTKKGTENILAKALRHPLRVEILAILDNRVSSPAELALELNQPLGKVAYHVRELVRFKCAELVDAGGEEGKRGHFYRAIRRPYFHAEDWQLLPQAAREGISNKIINMIGKDAAKSLGTGAFDRRKDRHLSRTPLVLDEQAWEELNSLLDEIAERGLDFQAEAAERLARSGKEGFSARLILIAFESGEAEAAAN